MGSLRHFAWICLAFLGSPQESSARVSARCRVLLENSGRYLGSFLSLTKPVVAFDKHSPYLDEYGFLMRKGRTTVEQANQQVRSFLDQRPRLRDNLKSMDNPPRLLHGSSSSSLLTFTKYGNFEGQLKPSNEIYKSGKAVYSGEIFFGMSDKGVSAVYLNNGEIARDYSRSDSWSPESSHSRLKELEKSFEEAEHQAVENGNLSGFRESIFHRGALRQISLEKRRQRDWKKLTWLEKDLVSNSFPVLYGVHVERKNSIGVSPGFDDELQLLGGSKDKEINAVFVPREKMDLVRDIFQSIGRESIRVFSLEDFDYRTDSR